MNYDENSKDFLENSDTDLEGNFIVVIVVSSVIVVIDELSGEEPAIMNTPWSSLEEVDNSAEDEVCILIPSDKDKQTVQANNDEDDMTVTNTVGIDACVVVNCSFKDEENDTFALLDAIDEYRLWTNLEDEEYDTLTELDAIDEDGLWKNVDGTEDGELEQINDDGDTLTVDASVDINCSGSFAQLKVIKEENLWDEIDDGNDEERLLCAHCVGLW